MPDLRLDPRSIACPRPRHSGTGAIVDDTLEWQAQAFDHCLSSGVGASARGHWLRWMWIAAVEPRAVGFGRVSRCVGGHGCVAEPPSSRSPGSLGLEAPDIGRLEDGLNKIARLSPELRHPIEAKVHLLQFLFETGGACLSRRAGPGGL